MTATERFKKYVSDLLERMFVLEEELECAHATIEELRRKEHVMGWKCEAAQAHKVEIHVTPTSADESTLTIVWGEKPAETKTVNNSEVEKLLHQTAEKVQQLGYMM